VKRTAELSLLDTTSFSRPLHGLWFKSSFDPSAEALGYFHSVRFADVENDFCGKVVSPNVGRSELAALSRPAADGAGLSISDYLVRYESLNSKPRLPHSRLKLA